MRLMLCRLRKLRGLNRGIEKGIEQEKITIAKSLLEVLDDKTIAQKTNLAIDFIQQLRNE